MNISQQKKQLVKWDKGIAGYLDNIAVSQWKDVDIEKYKDILYHLISRGPCGLNINTILQAQLFFRIHPTKKAPKDAFTLLEKIRKATQLITDAEIRDDLQAVTTKAGGLFTVIQKQIDQCTQHGTHLKNAGDALKNPSLALLIQYTVATSPMSPVDRKKFTTGSDLYNTMEEDHGTELTLNQYQERITNLLRTLQNNRDTIGEFQKDANPMLGVVLRDYYIAPLLHGLEKIKSSFSKCKKQSEPIVSKAQQIRIELVTDYTHSSLGDYLAGIDTYRDRIIRVTSDLANLGDVIDILETGKSLIEQCGSLTGTLNKAMPDLIKQSTAPESPINPIHTAEKIRKQYYFNGLWGLLKLLLAERIKVEFVMQTIGNCPVRIIGKDGKNIKDMKDTKMLEGYLRSTLSPYTLSWFHRTLPDIIKGGIVVYTKTIKTYLDGIRAKQKGSKKIGVIMTAIGKDLKRLP